MSWHKNVINTIAEVGRQLTDTRKLWFNSFVLDQSGDPLNPVTGKFRGHTPLETACPKALKKPGFPESQHLLILKGRVLGVSDFSPVSCLP